ncbi:MAG: site-specific integrase [Pirellulales bacterium]|nr:site-specific integrase [Pirellulales bacterium]
MAGLEVRNGRYNIIVRFGGKRFVRSLKTGDEEEAVARKTRVEENIRLVESGRLVIPDNADVITFLLSDGNLSKKPTVKKSLSLSALFKDFFDDIPEGNLEETTLNGMRLHARHLQRLIGNQFAVQQLSLDDLQGYVTKRSKEKTNKGTNVSANTINKELVTFRTAWGYGTRTGKLHGSFPREGIRLPKAKEMPIFQTWKQIETQVQQGASKELWDALYLDMSQIARLLRDVKRYAAFPFIHPMFTTAACTGARRSELMRSELADIDFTHKVITIREKKRVRGKLTTRRVPIAPPLIKVLRAWVKNHPGGMHTFCHADVVIERSRKSKQRESGPIALTGDEANCHFRQTVDGSKWEVLKGWHCLRHSFISNCASKGIDQRMIDEWVGHTTESMRRRYRHLFPSTQQDAMQRLFA